MPVQKLDPKPKTNSPKLPSMPKDKLNTTDSFGRNQDQVNKKSFKRWGNGRDWNNATSSEGGWVRIWPFNVETNNNNADVVIGKGSIKHMVLDVTRFTRIAKELFKNHPSASECQLNEFLQQQMEMTGEIWIPPV